MKRPSHSNHSKKQRIAIAAITTIQGVLTTLHTSSSPEAQVEPAKSVRNNEHSIDETIDEMTVSTAKKYRVGIVTGSQRVRRAGPQITDFVLNTIKAHEAASVEHLDIQFELVDVAALDLPLFDEPGIPSKINSAEEYANQHTRVWSRTISALDAFVFVTPQYNWGIPADLKNAIDYLFNEWKGKPAMVISYGGHGGDKCAGHLKTVLGGGIDMRVVEETVNLSFPDRNFLVRAATGKELGLDASDDQGTWAKERADIISAWEKMLQLMVV